MSWFRGELTASLTSSVYLDNNPEAMGEFKKDFDEVPDEIKEPFATEMDKYVVSQAQPELKPEVVAQGTAKKDEEVGGGFLSAPLPPLKSKRGNFADEVDDEEDSRPKKYAAVASSSRKPSAAAPGKRALTLRVRPTDQAASERAWAQDKPAEWQAPVEPQVPIKTETSAESPRSIALVARDNNWHTTGKGVNGIPSLEMRIKLWKELYPDRAHYDDQGPFEVILQASLVGRVFGPNSEYIKKAQACAHPVTIVIVENDHKEKKVILGLEPHAHPADFLVRMQWMLVWSTVSNFVRANRLSRKPENGDPMYTWALMEGSIDQYLEHLRAEAISLSAQADHRLATTITRDGLGLE